METLSRPKHLIGTKSTEALPGLLRFVICGSVDDGKSTLIGRLLYDAGLLYEDQLTTLALDSKRQGTNDSYDFSLLMDGLIAEREQKITIDIAWRFFATPKRAFIVADAPGHTQYTRNMATAASTATVAVVLVDAEKGLMTQTKRHTMIAALFGIQHVIFIVNKMDLVNYSESRFKALSNEYQRYARSLGISNIHSIPISALFGENILHHSLKMPWYHCKTFIQCLETIAVDTPQNEESFRLCVQWVNRPDTDFRGFSGQIAAGVISPGDPIVVLPSGQKTTVERIVTFDGDLENAFTGQSVTLTFKDDIDVSRGDVLAHAEHPCPIADQILADLLWIAEKPLVGGRQYTMKIGTTSISCVIDPPDYVLDIDTLEEVPFSELGFNQIGRCSLLLDRLTAIESYKKNRALGGFIISDKLTHEIVAAGIILSGVERALHIPYQTLSINQHMRSVIKLQKAFVVWLTGLSGAGKSTLANLLEKKLHARGHHTMLLDANNLRHGLTNNLGFTEACRIENMRRIAEVAKLMTEAGLITLVACIAPLAVQRESAAALIGKEQYIEIFVDAPLSVVEARDVNGLYAKARVGEITNFTGISAVYEAPTSPDLHLDTVSLSPDEAVQIILDWLIVKKMISV
ncbi:MAG: adenylyl-sulfate kinase [Legionella sp.]|nr:adenylyl-sulfate kinase [Legionella sp.]